MAENPEPQARTGDNTLDIFELDQTDGKDEIPQCRSKPEKMTELTCAQETTEAQSHYILA